jgi:CHAD domain-containing protein
VQVTSKNEVQVSTTSRALERSLQRALRNHKRARKRLKTEPVHDFRVALRRCRSLAEGLSAIDSDPVWRRLRKAAKRQQSALSDLRDLQVLQNWLKPLRVTKGPVGRALASYFKKHERRARRDAERSLKSFPRKRWKRWLRRLPAGTELIRVSQRRQAELVLEQLTRIIDLHERWTKESSADIWHDLRVSVKRFRYMVESFLPTESEAWSAELQKAQDLLGEGHDLDVLHELVSKLARKKSLPKTAARQSLRRIEAAARKRKAEYLALISQRSHRNGSGASANSPERENEATLWDRWRAELGAVASVNGRGGAGSSRSKHKTTLHVAARANQYPDKPRQISSAQ